MNLIAAILLLASSMSSALPAGVRELAVRLSQRAAFECDFVQERTLTGMRMPLRSTGIFRMEPGQKVSWIQERPVIQTILLTREGMELVRPDGSRQKLSRSTPVVGEIAQAMFALTQGDLESLGRSFDVSWLKRADADWSLRLLPKGVAAKAFRDIVLSGGDDLHSVQLTDAQGLVTRIAFGSHRAFGAQR